MILLTFGTRPEWIKIKPLVKVFKKNRYPYRVLFTGQHSTLIPSDAEKNIHVSVSISDGANRLDSIVKSLMDKQKIWDRNDISKVLVQGDTTSAFALALAAFHRRIPVIHLEAGLRTYDLDNPYPEEFNRQAISRLARIHLCPTNLSSQNLFNEGIKDGVHVTGNTVLDNLKDIVPTHSNIVPITMHRRENHHIMDLWFKQFEQLADKYTDLEFVFPMHPNPKVQKHKNLLNKVKVIDPLDYDSFIKLLAKSRLIISDSGGIQEESSFFKKRSIVCRKTTERIEGLGVFFELCRHPEDLPDLFEQAISKKPIESDVLCPFGDGNSSNKIYNILVKLGDKKPHEN